MTRANKVGVVAVPKEAQQQEALFQAFELMLVPLPDGTWEKLSELAFAVPNGTAIAGTPKQRAMYMNALKRQGFKPGVSDIVIPYMVAPFPGLMIELKRDSKSVVRDDQVRWRDLMRRAGYRAEIVAGFDNALAVVREYLGASCRTVSRPSSTALVV